MREPDQQLVQHREPADAGVEDPDGTAADVVGHGVSLAAGAATAETSTRTARRRRRRVNARLGRAVRSRSPPRRRAAMCTLTPPDVVNVHIARRRVGPAPHPAAVDLDASPPLLPLPDRVDRPLELLDDRLGDRGVLRPPLAFTTPARMTATSRIRPTYSTVP